VDPEGVHEEAKLGINIPILAFFKKKNLFQQTTFFERHATKSIKYYFGMFGAVKNNQ
jgi:hypothetical protein